MSDHTDKKKNQDEANHPKHTEFHEAPESGTVVQKDDPSQPDGAAKDQAKDSVGEAPESGTMREK